MRPVAAPARRKLASADWYGRAYLASGRANASLRLLRFIPHFALIGNSEFRAGDEAIALGGAAPSTSVRTRPLVGAGVTGCR